MNKCWSWMPVSNVKPFPFELILLLASRVPITFLSFTEQQSKDATVKKTRFSLRGGCLRSSNKE